MLHEDIVNFWGWENLKRWSEDSLRDVVIPQPSKQFLIQVGLPCNEDWTLRFDPEPDHVPRLPNKANYRRIGFDDDVPICLDEKRDGCVVAVETEVGGSERFINSSVERFGHFLVLYEEYRKAARAVSEEVIVKIIPGIEERMRKADPKVFDNPNNYWPVIVEQMNQGLL
ncbi:MAG: SUKH-4 family immunity protein [Methyloceanibacter sp.]